MSSKQNRRRSPVAIVLLVLGATLVAGLIAELALRLLWRQPAPLGVLSYADADGTPVVGDDAPAQAIRRGIIIEVPPPKPRFRTMFAPGKDFYLCYSDHRRLQRDFLDDQGRVKVHINPLGIRERDSITADKPAGERRIVCIGDSFTFGWGIPDERGWVRRLEDELRRDGGQGGGNTRTVNCGAAGTVCIDEYVVGLQSRFHVFQPDAVILTICLNDLVPSSGLSLIDPVPPTGSRLLDLLRAAFGRSPLDLDPARDWVQELLDLPPDQAAAGGLTDHDRPAEALWSNGVPQKFLREAKAWCEARKIPFLVVLWPFLQGLGPGRHYPFQKLHDLVAADCEAAGIPFADVLPSLRGTRDEDLWVTPGDMHANPRAQELALPTILALVRRHVPWATGR
ncbi:MAG: SGNH/GDSL hydrolase family protein [Planctomycetes bacterium]|nr:SGNH/GDSL hydrolase family protein [Planctomycetota bacterium]